MNLGADVSYFLLSWDFVIVVYRVNENPPKTNCEFLKLISLRLIVNEWTKFHQNESIPQVLILRKRSSSGVK